MQQPVVAHAPWDGSVVEPTTSVICRNRLDIPVETHRAFKARRRRIRTTPRVARATS
jgi:hypothetical protein